MHVHPQRTCEKLIADLHCSRSIPHRLRAQLSSAPKAFRVDGPEALALAPRAPEFTLVKPPEEPGRCDDAGAAALFAPAPARMQACSLSWKTSSSSNQPRLRDSRTWMASSISGRSPSLFSSS